MDISVIVPVHNSESTLDKCIISLLCQKTSHVYEIILIDNASKDNSSKILKKYLHKFPKKIKVFSERRLGRSFARNNGIKAAKGKKILFIDSDSWAENLWIEKLSKALNDAVLVGGQIKTSGKGSLSLYCNYFCHQQELYSKAKKPFFGTGNMGVHKKDIVDVGLFNTELKRAEDVDICIKILKKTKDIDYVADAVVYHMPPKNIFFLINSFENGMALFHLKEKDVFIRKMDNFLVYKKYGVLVFFLKIFDDIFFWLGYLFGKIMMIFR